MHMYRHVQWLYSTQTCRVLRLRLLYLCVRVAASFVLAWQACQRRAVLSCCSRCTPFEARVLSLDPPRPFPLLYVVRRHVANTSVVALSPCQALHKNKENENNVFFYVRTTVRVWPGLASAPQFISLDDPVIIILSLYAGAIGGS